MSIYLKLAILFFVSVSIQWLSIRGYKKYHLCQNIYELSPQRHQKKVNTPSLGGIGIIITIGLSLMFIQISVITGWIIAVIASFGCVGLIDDVSALIKKKNKGLSAKKKFILQCVISGILLIIFSYSIRELIVWEYILYGFVMVGASNATNLTDGLDGLLIGCALVTLGGFYMISHSLELQTIISVIGTACVAFFIFNRHPAKCFMGDTGSLALGAGFASLAIAMNNIWILVPLGAVYILETMSVMIQVIYFKWTKKRVFLMAPLHHHFEMMGISERAVVRGFWGISIFFLLWAMV